MEGRGKVDRRAQSVRIEGFFAMSLALCAMRSITPTLILPRPLDKLGISDKGEEILIFSCQLFSTPATQSLSRSELLDSLYMVKLPDFSISPEIMKQNDAVLGPHDYCVRPRSIHLWLCLKR